jgi:CDP-diacylglycerol--glycerol-3-phosphate 3-phosphatidyltransferase
MGLANKITIVRILLVPFLVSCLLYYKPEYDYLRFVALGIFFISGLTDAIDGYIARKFYQKTKLGKILDPLADKLLILTAFISLAVIKNIPLASRIPPWLTIMVISRDSIILLGAAIIFIMNKEIEIKPSLLGKITTFFQMATVAAAFLQLGFAKIIWWLTAFFTISSCLGYVFRGTRLLNEPHRP